MHSKHEVIEDTVDDTTGIRTVTEQAVVDGEGWLIRTAVYTAHHVAQGETFIPDHTLVPKERLVGVINPQWLLNGVSPPNASGE